MSNLENFISEIRKNDLARSNRFEVEFFSPVSSTTLGQTISVLCEDAAIPGLLVPYSPIKIGNWTEPRVHGVEFFGDNATFTFYCDTKWNVRQYFEDWMFTAADPTSKEVGFYDQYVGSVIVHTLNRQDKIEKSWTLIEAVPRNISLTPVSQGNESIARVSISLAYKLWQPGALGVTNNISSPAISITA